jgi:hypothetical protein
MTHLETIKSIVCRPVAANGAGRFAAPHEYLFKIVIPKRGSIAPGIRCFAAKKRIPRR